MNGWLMSCPGSGKVKVSDEYHPSIHIYIGVMDQDWVIGGGAERERRIPPPLEGNLSRLLLH